MLRVRVNKKKICIFLLNKKFTLPTPSSVKSVVTSTSSMYTIGVVYRNTDL